MSAQSQCGGLQIEAEMIFFVIVIMSIAGFVMSSIGIFVFGMNMVSGILVFYTSALILPFLAALLLSFGPRSGRILSSKTKF